MVCCYNILDLSSKKYLIKISLSRVVISIGWNLLFKKTSKLSWFY